ncbi:hypothetical protein [Bacillus sp. MUM 116]|uniref:hypothetical protein n=1 Tax=Bacillus sp. MUM 116 TaxID=1678002 RepID=UPI0009F39D56|nr:hypothetical protein [Bacillus sp. MUM 116]
MMDQEIIERIVLEVIKQLTASQGKLNNTAKQKLLVVGDPLLIEPKYLVKLESKWEIIYNNELEKVRSEHFDQVVFLHATQDLLAKGALGIFDTNESKLLSWCLLESIPVSIIPTVYLEKYLFNGNPKNMLYVSQLLEYKQRLVKFGANVETLESFVVGTEEVLETISAKSPISEKKKLLTQRDVQDCRDDELVVDKQTIITPLARDTAREMGKRIKVIESKGAKR